MSAGSLSTSSVCFANLEEQEEQEVLFDSDGILSESPQKEHRALAPSHVFAHKLVTGCDSFTAGKKLM